MKSQFIGDLDARHIEGPWWRLLSPFGFYSAEFDITVCAPPGFVTDFSSVPRLPVAYWLTGGTGNQESVPHDVGYRWFSERLMFDMMFCEGGRVRSNERENQHWLYRSGRWIRTSGMTCAVVSIGWAVKTSLPGCLDYRHRKECKIEGYNCAFCENYYPSWMFCKMVGYQPDILKLHART